MGERTVAETRCKNEDVALAELENSFLLQTRRSQPQSHAYRFAEVSLVFTFVSITFESTSWFSSSRHPTRFFTWLVPRRSAHPPSFSHLGVRLLIHHSTDIITSPTNRNVEAHSIQNPHREWRHQETPPRHSRTDQARRHPR